MKILETERLILREIVETDDAFMLDLLNQPSFIKYIGDRGVRNVEQARAYIETRLRESYRVNGFGLYAVELRLNPVSIGICGFVKRGALPAPDIGFAFLPQFCGAGFAVEAADAAMRFGADVLGFKDVLAVTSKDNESSGRLLEKLDFKFERFVTLPPDAEELKLFSFHAGQNEKPK